MAQIVVGFRDPLAATEVLGANRDERLPASAALLINKCKLFRNQKFGALIGSMLHGRRNKWVSEWELVLLFWTEGTAAVTESAR